MIFKIMETKEQRKQRQKKIKNYLKGRFIWRSKFVFLDIHKHLEYLKYGNRDLHNQGTYIKPKADKKISFTEELRSEKGYDKYLATQFKTV